MGAAARTHIVTVSQLARGWEIVSATVAPDDVTFLDAGRYSFQVDVGGRARELSVDVLPGASNQDTLLRVANAINRADLGVGARVDAQPLEGTVRLVVENESTGSGATLSFNDVRRDLVSTLELDASQAAGQNQGGTRREDKGRAGR